MKIKALFISLLLSCGVQTIAYGQQSEGNSEFRIQNSEFHKAPPRKEIRHKLTQHPQDNYLLQAATRASGEYIMQQFPTTGDIKGVVILAAFTDVPFSISSDSISTLLSNRFNADNYSEQVKFNEYSEVYGQYLPLDDTIPGSARDYFRTQSFDKFSPSFDIVGPVTLSQKRSYYGANNSSGNDKNTAAMIREACQKAYDLGLTDFTNYDNDGDGTVDFVYVVYAGSDEAQTGITEAIWAKASNISLTLGNGMKIKRYACSGELVIDLPVVAGIGTFIHEFSHVLGLPDFYNTKSEDFTMDVWSVMDYGMYNAEGFVPCAYTAFERYSLGWIPMHTLDQPATMSIGTTEEEGKGYRIFTSNIDNTGIITPADTASFYVIETIRQEGWNKYAANYYGEGAPPIHGLLISEVTYDATAWKGNTVNSGTKHRHCIVPANNVYNYKNAHLHLFGNTNHEFTPTSAPSSITQFGATMNKPLTDINYDAATGKTSFHFCGGTPVPDVPDVPNVPDGIEVGPTVNSQQPTAIYDLLGRPVTHPTKGVYIVGGKKIVIND